MIIRTSRLINPRRAYRLRKFAAATVLGLTTISAVATLSGQAAAGIKAERARTHKEHVNYTKTWTFKSPHLHRCVFIKASGRINYTLVDQPGKPVSTFTWKNQVLRDPSLTIRITGRSKSGKCTGPAKLVKVSMQQDWTGYSCSFNPSLSVSVPWGVSISAWPSCGNRNQAGFKSDPPGKLSHYSQFNNGSPAGFANFQTSPQAGPGPCYGIYPTIVAYLTGTSDSYNAGNSKAQKVCLPFNKNVF